LWGLKITDIDDEEPLLREAMQGLREAEIDEPPPYILSERPRWLEEALKTGADTSELERTPEMYDLKGDLKDE
jgi:hypothetical protein